MAVMSLLGLQGPRTATIANLLQAGTLSGATFYSGFYNGLTMSGPLIDIGTCITSTSAAYTGLNLENSSETNGTYAPFITFSRRSDSGTYNMPYAAIGAIRTGAVTGDSNWNAGDMVFSTNPLTADGMVERMRLMSSGNVGIRIDVAGDNFRCVRLCIRNAKHGGET